MGIFESFGNNRDWMGPIVIPEATENSEGFVFVLGDNRHNSSDSRYHGFVKVVDILGTVQ